MPSREQLVRPHHAECFAEHALGSRVSEPYLAHRVVTLPSPVVQIHRVEVDAVQVVRQRRGVVRDEAGLLAVVVQRVHGEAPGWTRQRRTARDDEVERLLLFVHGAEDEPAVAARAVVDCALESKNLSGRGVVQRLERRQSRTRV
jgi:hypothetical protein